MLQRATGVSEEFVKSGLELLDELQRHASYNVLFFGANPLSYAIGNNQTVRFLFLWLCEIEGIRPEERLVPLVALSPTYYENGFNTLQTIIRQSPNNKYRGVSEYLQPPHGSVNSTVVLDNPYVSNFFSRRRGYVEAGRTPVYPAVFHAAVATFFLRWCARYVDLGTFLGTDLRNFRELLDRVNMEALVNFVKDMPEGSDREKFSQMLSLPIKGFRRRYSRVDNSLTEYFNMESLV